jgi:hypothetical protein
MVDGTPHYASGGSGNEDRDDDLGGALDFSGPASYEEPAAAAWDDFAPPAEAAAEDTGETLEALQSLTEADEEDYGDLALYTVTNPSKSVAVTALMDGRIQFVKLTDKVERMTESDLADEIFVLADLARQKARAGQYSFLLDSLSDDAEGTKTLRDLVDLTLNLPTPEEAAAKEEEVFAQRYFSDTYGEDD